MTDKYADLLGQYNDCPVGLTEITEKEFANSLFFSYPAEHTCYKQVTRDSQGNRLDQMLALHCFVYHDGTGIAMASLPWEGKVIYHRFGCKHEYRELSSDECFNEDIPHFGRCWHVTRCEKCGHIQSYDSSD